MEYLKYRIVLLDEDGYVLGESEAETLSKGRERARYMLSDEYARATESTHEHTHKVEVRNQAGQCVWDSFPPITSGKAS